MLITFLVYKITNPFLFVVKWKWEGEVMVLKKIKRNDLCYCGSGKKYKKCCLNKEKAAPTWRTEASKIEIGLYQDKVTDAFFVVSDYLKEQKVECDLCIGEVQAQFGRFDHSWTQINGDVYDIAIQIQLDEIERDPVFAGIDLGTGKKSESIYGISDGNGLDAIASKVTNIPFVEYMDGFPMGAWDITKDLLRKLNITRSVDELRDKYKQTERKFITIGK